MKTAIGFVFVTLLAIAPAAAWECGSKQVVASTPAPVSTPVQTAEAPSPTQTK